MHHGQAQAGAFADRLGGEEWFEDALQVFGVHAVAGVGDGQPRIVDRMQFGMCLEEASSGRNGSSATVNVPVRPSMACSALVARFMVT